MFPLFHSRQKANLPEVPSLSGSSAPLGCRSLRVVPTPEPAPAGLAPGPPGALSGPPMASVSLGPAVCSHHTHLPPPGPLAAGDRRSPPPRRSGYQQVRRPWLLSSWCSARFGSPLVPSSLPSPVTPAQMWTLPRLAVHWPPPLHFLPGVWWRPWTQRV